MNLTHTYIPLSWLAYAIGASLLLAILAFFYGRECRYCRQREKERQRAATREEYPFLRRYSQKAVDEAREMARVNGWIPPTGIPAKPPVAGNEGKE